MIGIICVQMLVIGFILFKDNKKEKYPMGRKYLEYAFIDDQYNIKILDQNNEDITEEFLNENRKYYLKDDWDKIMENFEKQSGNMSIVDKYDR